MQPCSESFHYGNNTFFDLYIFSLLQLKLHDISKKHFDISRLLYERLYNTGTSAKSDKHWRLFFVAAQEGKISAHKFCKIMYLNIVRKHFKRFDMIYFVCLFCLIFCCCFFLFWFYLFCLMHKCWYFCNICLLRFVNSPHLSTRKRDYQPACF